MHIPVLLTEVLEDLSPRPGGRFVDGTAGGGGHAVAILKAIGPTGFLLGVDRDGAALKAARERLESCGGRFELRQGTFDRLPEWVPENSCDGVILDLGVSSPQLDEAERGFSFMSDGPLDMRMDGSQRLTAEEVVNSTPVDELETILAEFGEEPRARRLARAIDHERKVRRLKTTGELAALVERVSPRRGARLHPATRVFQAIRMVVNDEPGQLRRGLVAALRVLRPNGRLAVITFHSLEARIVKEFGRQHSRDYAVEGEVDVPELRRPVTPDTRWVRRHAMGATASEISANPRARSAQLRVLEKLRHAP